MDLSLCVMVSSFYFASPFPCLHSPTSSSPPPVGVAGPIRAASFRNRRGSMRGSLRGSLRGSFHGNRGSSFRGGSFRGRKGSKRGSFRVPNPAGVGMSPAGKGSPSNLMKPKVETKLDISLFYQVFPEEVLGSGQFGTVFGGNGWTISATHHSSSPSPPSSPLPQARTGTPVPQWQ